MEEIEEVKQNPQEEQSVEQNPADDETKEEDKVVIHIMLEGDMSKGRNQGKREIQVIVVNPQAAVEELGKVAEKQINSLKKPKQSSCKQINPKTKNTVPRPFSLATEKRMNVDRLRSSDVKPPKPTLTKSASLNYKNLAQPSLVADKTRDLRPATSTRPLSKTSLRPQVTTDKQVNKKVEEGNDVGSSSKLGKSSTFKALPLPSFYHRKDLPPKPEAKKTPVTHSKPPMFGQISKQAAVPKSKSSKTAEDQKPKRVMRASSFTAKETIRSSLGTTREIVKSVVTCA